MITDTREIIKNGLNLLEDKNYENAIKIFEDAHKFYSESNSDEDVSISLSLLGMAKYLLDKNCYIEALKFLNDARYMAQYSKNNTAKIIAEYAQGTIEFGEGNREVALLHFKNAQGLLLENVDELSINGYISTRIKQIESGVDFEVPIKSDPLVSLVKIGRSITAVTDIDVLIKVIAEETKIAIQADRCTVFLLDKNENELWSKVALGML